VPSDSAADHDDPPLPLSTPARLAYRTIEARHPAAVLAHAVDEHVSLDSLHDGVRGFEAIVAELLDWRRR